MKRPVFRRDDVPLLLLLGLGLATRLHQLARQGFWIDEGFSVALAGLSPAGIIAGTAADQHPPLYYLLLHGWLGLAGRSEFAVCFLSVAAGVLALAVLYAIGRRLSSARLGLWSVLLLVFSPIHIQYSQEARMYALLALLGLLSVYTLLRWLERPSLGMGALYVLCTAAALYTHNLALFLLPVEAVWVVVRAITRPDGGRRRLVLDGRRLGGWLLCLVAIVLLWLPWLPTLVMQTRTHRASWIVPPTLPMLRDTLLHISTGILTGRTLAILGWLWLAGTGLAVALTWKRSHARQPALLFSGLWFGLPAALIAGLGLAYPLYQDKQFVFLVPALLSCLAAGLLILRSPWRILAVVALLALQAAPLYDLYYRGSRPEWREAIRYLDANARPGDVIVLNPAAGELMLDLYAAHRWPVIGFPQDYDILVGGFVGDMVTSPALDTGLGPALASYQRVWLLEFTADVWDPGRLIVAWLETHAWPQPVPAFAYLELRLYDVGRE